MAISISPYLGLDDSAIEYPESDGLPLGETDVHIQLLFDLRGMLTQHFASAPDVYVSGNNFLYYQQGDPNQVVSPDLYVVRGLARAKEPRRTYRLWVEGRVPDWVFEATSTSTRRQDFGAKRGLYEELGVQEYVVFDPLGEYLDPPLQGYELRGGRYKRQATMAASGLYSRVLGLELRAEGGRLRLYNPSTGQYLLTPGEAYAAADAAAANIAQLRAELERLRGQNQA